MLVSGCEEQVFSTGQAVFPSSSRAFSLPLPPAKPRLWCQEPSVGEQATGYSGARASLHRECAVPNPGMTLW